jgi:YD repeat-containing protein
MLVALALSAAFVWMVNRTAQAQNAELNITLQGTNLHFFWPSFTGATYTVQTRLDLQTGSWATATSVLATGSASGFTTPLGNEPARFWRLLSPLPILQNIHPSFANAGSPFNLHLSGQYLAQGDLLRIGGVLVSNLSYLNSTLWSATAPILPPGVYDMEVVSSTTGQILATLSDAIEIAPMGSAYLLEPPEGAPGDPSSSACSETSHSQRIYGGSGEFKYQVTDLRIPGRGLDFKWCRTYRSRTGSATTMGNGWSHSYDIRIETNGLNVVLRDGTGRADRFLLQPDGTYARNEFFSLITRNNDTFVVWGADKGLWEFNPMDGSTAAGKIRQIQDRNGNALKFDYDGAGRLVRVIDTLDRTNMVAYNASGCVAAVTDFSGRMVQYEYFGDGDAGGSSNDLRAAISPAVVGTPNGNDFPGGKTNRYTYTTGFADDRLNHNLLTIMDAKGQVWLQNIYATNLNPANFNFDRVTVQTLGGPGHTLEYVYVPQIPGPSNGFATTKTIINDRVGNVSEHFFDARNRAVRRLEYTGRAVPNQPTGELANRPINPLRPNDPVFFETRTEWNIDSKATRVRFPNGSSTEFVYERDLNPSVSRRGAGNLRERRQFPGPLGADQTVLVESFDYDTGFGSCCGFNFMTRHVDARGNQTLHAYDARGNRTNTTHRIPSITEQWEYNAFGQVTAHILPDNGSGHRRRDEFTYYTAGPQRGYQRDRIVDAGFLGLKTTMEYDALGNLTRVIDARGHDSLYTVNALNQRVRELSQETATGSGIRYEKLYWYDANDNLVRTDEQNRDDVGGLQANTHFSVLREYEILNRPTLRIAEKGNANLAGSVLRWLDIPVPLRAQFILEESQYDANRNRRLVRSPEATNGNDTNNVVQFLHDERDRLFKTVRAPGSSDQSTTQFDYDANGNRIREIEGLEDDPHTTTFAYDGFDRQISRTDAMGNVTLWGYDPNGNLRTNRFLGELVDVVGSAGNVRLSESVFTYDAMNRLVRRDDAFFNPQTQMPIGDGQATTRTIYSAASQVLATIDDNNHTNRVAYDTANRPSVVTDAKNNTRTSLYDSNNNVVVVIELDKSDFGAPDESFTTRFAYDPLNRLITAGDNRTNTTQFAYDSRHNRTLVTDANGNRTRHDFDGLKREIAKRLDMNTNNTFADVVDIVTRSGWDDNSRLITQTDDNTNTTTHVYDSLNRRVQTIFADGATNVSTFNAHSKVISSRDANGTVVANTYDDLDRLIARHIARGPGVLGTTNETYQYDARALMVLGQNEDAIAMFTYDSLSRAMTETLNGQTTARVYDGVGNKLSTTYPGTRVVTRTFDPLNRPNSITDQSGLLASLAYAGPRRLSRIDYGNGTRMDYTYNGITGIPNAPGDEGVQRISGSTLTRIGVGTLDEMEFAWDAAGNKTRRHGLTLGIQQNFSYDAANRLIQSSTSSGPFAGQISYAFDGVGNRTSVTGGQDAGAYGMDPALPEPADFQMNQYSTTPFDARQYDKMGNLLTADEAGPALKSHSYDYRNRLVQFSEATTGLQISYQYDVLGRRTERTVIAPPAAADVTRFFYDGKSVIEEQNGLLAMIATITWPDDIEMPWVIHTERLGAKYYLASDDQGSVIAATDASGNLVERFAYSDYGSSAALDPVGVPLPASITGHPYLFQGHSTERNGSIWWASRYAEPVTGKFQTRDTGGIWFDAATHGNGLTLLANNPWSRSDPDGKAVNPLLVAAVPLLLATANIAACHMDVIQAVLKCQRQQCPEGYTVDVNICYGMAAWAFMQCSLSAGNLSPGGEFAGKEVACQREQKPDDLVPIPKPQDLPIPDLPPAVLPCIETVVAVEYTYTTTTWEVTDNGDGTGTGVLTETTHTGVKWVAILDCW